MEYGYSKHQCTTTLSSRESLLGLNKQTVWGGWSSFACTVVKTKLEKVWNTHGQTHDSINETWHLYIFYVIQFSKLIAIELQFTYYSKYSMSIHCVCMGVDACACVYVFVSVNKRGEGSSWRVSLWSAQVDSDPLCSWGPASPFIAPRSYHFM